MLVNDFLDQNRINKLKLNFYTPEYKTAIMSEQRYVLQVNHKQAYYLHIPGNKVHIIYTIISHM